MVNFIFATLRLGKTSVDDIKLLNGQPGGAVQTPVGISVVCTQIPSDLDVGVYSFIWLGSDNSKGMATEWKQGFKAIGRITGIKRGEKYNDESITDLDVIYIFPDAINRLDILRDASKEYYRCSSMPIIGLDDHSNQTIRMLVSGEHCDVNAFFSALNAVHTGFRDEILSVEPEFNQFFESVDEASFVGSAQIPYLSPEWFKMKSAEYPQVDAEANALYQKFQEQYAPEILRNLSDEELLGYIFLGVGDTSLCNALEFDPQYNQFGSIAGGTSYKYSLFYSRNSHAWKTSFGEGGQRSISDDEALDIGKQIRDALVTGADIIGSWESLSTVNDYNELLTALNAAIPQYITKMWFLKYYHMIFPELIPNFYNAFWHRHILCSLNIVPSDVQFIRMGQINCFVKECGISNIMFGHILPDSIGMPKTFFRIGTGENGAYFNDWYEKNYVAIGWNELGDLSTVYQDDADSKAVIVDALRSHWNYDTRLASRKYGEINNFYSAVVEDTYVVAMSGQKILAIGVFSGSYYFDEDKEYGHCRAVRWLKAFGEKKKLPNENEGMRTTFYELKDSENLCYLYSLLYFADEEEEHRDETKIKTTEERRPVRFNTGLDSNFPRNRILFGAPGTGKSYTLNHEKDILLTEGGEYERVTFHPDYSYANFVGTYKPVHCKDSEGKDAITYKYVPGPFMRTYVKALENSRSDDVKPFLLIIEEINRANVAAVFGDIFQLLDRNDDETSEYPIQASEDIKTYLSDTLELSPDECTEICLPDNMFIWATMNSADQGVFPMDTAFKRRWDFTYLGIDDSDQDIRGKYVFLAGDKSQKVEWNKLRKAINHFLQKEKINEDKQLGPYFIARNIIVPQDGDEIDRDRFIRTFKNKVIMYLFEDAAKQKRSKLFDGCSQNSSRYSEICREFEENGIRIFNSDIQNEAEVEDVIPIETSEE